MVRLAWLRQHGFWLTLFFLVTLAVLLRSIGFGQVPVSLYWDEMAIWNDARSIATTGLDLHGRSWFQPLFISYGDYKLPVYIWFVSFVSRFVDSAALAVRLPSFLAGVSMVFGGAVFWLGVPDLKTDLKRKLALVTAAVITVMPWSIHFSTVGFEGHLSSAFVLWSAVALMWSVSRKHWQWRLAFVGLSVFLGTLSVYTYFSTRFVWPVIFVVLVAAWWTKTRQWWWLYGIGLFIWMFSLLPMVQADFYAASNQLRLSTESILTLPAAEPTALNELRLQSGNTFVSKAIYNRWTLTALAGGKNVLQHFDPEYLFFQGDQKLRHGVPGYGLLYGLFCAIFGDWSSSDMASFLASRWVVDCLVVSGFSTGFGAARHAACFAIAECRVCTGCVCRVRSGGCGTMVVGAVFAALDSPAWFGHDPRTRCTLYNSFYGDTGGGVSTAFRH
ncbi:hypothetical protein LRY60_03505 [Candidatus Woesebacteria bacterium]|nr:hypothetical protein [Candidatus Woesebacteria bacterium]